MNFIGFPVRGSSSWLFLLAIANGNFEERPYRALQMSQTLIQIPYFSQLDNRNNPHGSCNVTSVAMCIHHFGIRGDGSAPQLEDQLYQRCLDRGWDRHSPHHLKKLVESYGLKDDFSDRGSFDDIWDAIDHGQLVVLHGYFTRSGHIVVCKGYDGTGLIINDPYGEYFESGYDTSVSGEGLHYSYGLISRTCSPESEASPKHIWMHRIYR